MIEMTSAILAVGARAEWRDVETDGVTPLRRRCPTGGIDDRSRDGRQRHVRRQHQVGDLHRMPRRPELDSGGPEAVVEPRRNKHTYG